MPREGRQGGGVGHEQGAKAIGPVGAVGVVVLFCFAGGRILRGR